MLTSLRRVSTSFADLVRPVVIATHQDQGELPALAATIAGLRKESDYTRLADRFAIRRTHPDFWAYLDELHRATRQNGRLEFGLFDLSRLENR